MEVHSPPVVPLPRDVPHEYADDPEQSQRPVVRVQEEMGLHLVMACIHTYGHHATSRCVTSRGEV